MKWIFRNTLIVVLALGVTPSFAKHAHVISGIDAARHYYGKSADNIYIRAGSFSHESNAKRVQALVKSKAHYPVIMAHHQSYYVVTIGPIATAAEARQVADAIPDELSASPARAGKHPFAPKTTMTSAISTVPALNQRRETDPVNHIDPADPIPETKHSVTSLTMPPGWMHGVYLSVGAGDLFNRVEGDNFLATGPGWPDDHYNSNGITDQPYFAVGIGYTWSRSTDWLPYYSLGLKLMYASSATVSGTIDQYSLPQFRNYNFNYDIALLNIMGTVKVDLYRWKNLMPYLTAGIGGANYSTSQYKEAAVGGVTPRVSPGFGAGSGTNFSYTAGVGLDWAALPNLWVNLEYNYMDVGTVSTDKGANYTTLTGMNYSNDALKNKMSSTSVFLGLTYYLS